MYKVCYGSAVNLIAVTLCYDGASTRVGYTVMRVAQVHEVDMLVQVHEQVCDINEEEDGSRVLLQ